MLDTGRSYNVAAASLLDMVSFVAVVVVLDDVMAFLGELNPATLAMAMTDNRRAINKPIDFMVAAGPLNELECGGGGEA